MKLIQIVTAYAALERLAKMQMRFGSAFKVMSLRQKLEPHWRTYAELEHRLIVDFAKPDKSGQPELNADGSFSLRSDSTLAEYSAKRMELNAVEVDEQFDVVDVVVDGDIRITPAELEALLPFVRFIWEG